MSIPTLQNRSLRDVRCWRDFAKIDPSGKDRPRAHTINLCTLSLPNTVPMARDLVEMLTWPKVLKTIRLESVPADNMFFEQRNFSHDTNAGASPKAFVDGIYSKRHNLEEIVYNNGEDKTETDCTTFVAVLRDFPNLKRLGVTRACLVRTEEEREVYGTVNLYDALPPRLEDFVIELESDFRWGCYDDNPDHGYFYESELQAWLLGVAVNKESHFPRLQRVTIWHENYQIIDIHHEQNLRLEHL